MIQCKRILRRIPKSLGIGNDLTVIQDIDSASVGSLFPCRSQSSSESQERSLDIYNALAVLAVNDKLPAILSGFISGKLRCPAVNVVQVHFSVNGQQAVVLEA